MKKINISDLLNRIHKIDKSIWKSMDMSTYFAPVMLLFVVLGGTCLGAIYMLSQIFGLSYVEIYGGTVLTFILPVWTALVAESISFGNNIGAMVGRSLLMLPVIVIIFVLSYVLSILVTCVVTIVVVFYVCAFFIRLFNGSSNSKKRKWKTEDGETLTESGSGLLGERYAKDSRGNEYKVDGNSATPR